LSDMGVALIESEFGVHSSAFQRASRMSE
jgi:hypothetical protein